MKIEGIGRDEILVTIDGRQLKIEGEIILKNGQYCFCANKESIHKWSKPLDVIISEKEKQDLISKIIEFSNGKKVRVIFN